MNYIELILQLSIIFPILYWIDTTIPILLLSITLDSIFSAINFIKLFILDDLSQAELLLNLNKLYKINLIDRYIYYISLQIVYITVKILTWNISLTYLYWSLMLTTCPYIFNFICTKYLYEIIDYIKIEKKRFFKIVICKQVAIVINTISTVCIDKNPEISFTELLYLLDDYDNIVNNFITFLKNFCIVSIVHYARKRTGSVYSKLISYVYTYKTGNMLESIDYSTAKNRFTDVIVNRKWKKLLDDDILQSIIYMYSLQESGQFNLGIYLVKFNYMLIKMFTIWTIGGFLNSTLIIPIMSLFFSIYKKPIKLFFKKEQIHKFLFKCIAFIIGLLINNYLLISLICEFGYILIINKVAKTIAQHFYDRFIKLYKVLTHYNQYNMFLIGVFIYIEFIKMIEHFFTPIWQYYVISYIVVMIYTNDNNKRLIYTGVISLGILSNYSEIHLLYILVFSYIYLNIDHHYKNNKNVSISIIAKKLHPSAMESYYNKLKPIEEDKSDNESDNDSVELFDSSLSPNEPVIVDNEFNEQLNSKIYVNNIEIVDNYV